MVVQADGKGFIRAGDGKVIYLAEEEDASSFKSGGVDGAIMRRAFESELRGTQDSRDVLFPEFSRFGVVCWKATQNMCASP